MSFAPTAFVTGIDSPVTMDSSIELRPSNQLAVDRHLLARADAQAIADRDRFEADLFVRAVGADATGGFRREIEQRPNRAAGLFARAQFENLRREARATVIAAAASK